MLFVSKKRFKKIKYIALLTITLAILFIISYNKNEILKSLYPIKYSEYINKYSLEYDLSPQLVFSIIRVESNFNPSAESGSGAKGLMQITDNTGEWIAKQMKITDYDNTMLFNPEKNIMMGCWYLRNLINQFKDLTVALAAYNGGSGNVQKWLNDREYSTNGQQLDKIPFGETEKYIHRVKNDYNVYKNLYGE